MTLESALYELAAIAFGVATIVWFAAGLAAAGMITAITLRHVDLEIQKEYRILTLGIFWLSVLYGPLLLVLFLVSLKFDPWTRERYSGWAYPGWIPKQKVNLAYVPAE